MDSSAQAAIKVAEPLGFVTFLLHFNDNAGMAGP